MITPWCLCTARKKGLQALIVASERKLQRDKLYSPAKPKVAPRVYG